jgi:hypothetical protein
MLYKELSELTNKIATGATTSTTEKKVVLYNQKLNGSS